MPEFELTYEGQVRELYTVEAETEEEARQVWADTAPKPFLSESYGGEVTEVKRLEDV